MTVRDNSVAMISGFSGKRMTFRVVHGAGRDVAYCPPTDGDGGNRNAALIAAAPDLLAACELWDQGFVDGEQFDAMQLLEWVNKNRRAAREAIAKAKGA